jgi:hypothetical protein
MKIIEFTNGIQLPITNEESDLLNRFTQDQQVGKSSLTEREQVLANQLVNKGVLLRRNQDGQIKYSKQTNNRTSYY